ncbi:putative L-type lectin-domain containing receptor kinase S.5 [Acorus calamus]|uniref:L-type lectin-domain containing receptor kinase S.5 n=1 Tax=Acorus calamus TaxID=4465 RepID=A0AAV9DSM9_ACOCL|nr:putative L-type lectin-domain containing receptor kinase S.5 [Acorus calamus]
MRIALRVLVSEAPMPDLPMERPAFVWPVASPHVGGSMDCLEDHLSLGGQLSLSDISDGFKCAEKLYQQSQLKILCCGVSSITC